MNPVKSIPVAVPAFALWLAATGMVHATPLPAFSDIVEHTGPAVVNISTSQRRQAPAVRIQPEQDDDEADRPFNELFRRFFGEEGERGFDLEEFDTRAMGSGFIISGDGYVLTNYHVVRGADEIVVTLSDRRQLVAELVGHDRDSDLALLKVDADGLPAVRVGDSGGLRVGEWVLAIGSPFGFEQSVSAGIVSAKGRALRSERFIPFIQTDVAINPGNSGGPLFNLDGEVIGINSQIYSRTGGAMGVSFAIPIEIALDVVGQLRTAGHVSRGWLGVNIQDVSRELAESFGMGKPEGALVSRVLEGSPAEAAGFRVGDVILEYDGEAVDRSATLPQLVGGAPAGRSVDVRVLRDGEYRTLRVDVGELPRPERVARATVEEPATTGALGIVIGDLSDGQRRVHDLPDHGVLVEEVGLGAGMRGGLREGDVILMIGGSRVRDAVHFDELARSLDPARPVSVLIQRGGAPLFLALQVGDSG